MGFIIFLGVIATYAVTGIVSYHVFEMLWDDDMLAFFGAFFWPVGIVCFLLRPFRSYLWWPFTKVIKYATYAGHQYYVFTDAKFKPQRSNVTQFKKGSKYG